MNDTLSRVDGRRPRRALLGVVSLLVVLACGPTDLREEARRMQQAGRFAASLTPLRTLLADGVDEPEVDMLYGSALQRTGSPVMAIWAFRRAMEDPEWFESAGLALALGLQRAKQYDQAVAVTSEVLDRHPDNISALMVRAMARAGTRRDYEGVIEDADRALEIDPDAVTAQVARTIALLGLDRAEEAGDGIALVEAYYANDELNLENAARYCATRASFESEKGEVERAEEVFEICLERYPFTAIVVSAAVEFFERQNQYDRALDILRSVVAANPVADDFRVALVQRLDLLGQTEEAIGVLEAATELTGRTSSAQAWFDLAGYQISREAYDQGIEAYEKAMALLHHIPPDRLFAFADALIVAGRYQRALEVADNMTVDPHKEFVRGRVHFEQGNDGQALEHFSSGLVLWPDNGIARYLAARASENLGDFDRAVEEYRYTIRIDAGATDARLRLARIYMALGQLGPALEVIRHNNQKAPPDIEMALLEIEILQGLGMLRNDAPPHLIAFLEVPDFRGSLLLGVAANTRQQAGASGAIEVVERIVGLDLTEPENAAILRMLIGDLVDAGRAEEASDKLAAALKAHPDVAAFHAIRGSLLERTGAPVERVQAAFMRAIEIDPAEANALAGRARGLASAGRTDEAIEFYLRSAEAAARDTEALTAALVVARRDDDSSRLRTLLELWFERDPYNGAVAFELAQLRAGDERGPETIALARRAVRFDGRSEAVALLEALLAPVPLEAATADP